MKVLKLLILVLVLFSIKPESCDKINDLFFFFNWLDPPVVDDEGQLGHFGFGLFVLIIVWEWLTHDGNQHVKHVETHEEREADEQEDQNRGHVIPEVRICIELSQGGAVHMVESSWQSCVARNPLQVAFRESDLLLVFADVVERADESKLSDDKNSHEILDIRQYNHDDVNQRSNLFDKPQEVETLHHDE